MQNFQRKVLRLLPKNSEAGTTLEVFNNFHPMPGLP
jgi:hypothetical protein